MTATEKVRMLRCATFFVVAAYAIVRLTPQNLRALLRTFYEAVPFLRLL